MEEKQHQLYDYQIVHARWSSFLCSEMDMLNFLNFFIVFSFDFASTHSFLSFCFLQSSWHDQNCKFKAVIIEGHFSLNIHIFGWYIFVAYPLSLQLAIIFNMWRKTWDKLLCNIESSRFSRHLHFNYNAKHQVKNYFQFIVIKNKLKLA